MKTIDIPMTQIQVGNIAHFYGARFEIVSIKTYPQDKDNIEQYGEISETMCAHGRWIDGEIICGYFGPEKDWKFQGNSHARVSIES